MRINVAVEGKKSGDGGENEETDDKGRIFHGLSIPYEVADLGLQYGLVYGTD